MLNEMKKRRSRFESKEQAVKEVSLTEEEKSGFKNWKELLIESVVRLMTCL